MAVSVVRLMRCSRWGHDQVRIQMHLHLGWRGENVSHLDRLRPVRVGARLHVLVLALHETRAPVAGRAY